VGSGRVLECTTGPLQHAGTRLVTTISVDHLSGDTHMIPVKPFMMMALGRGVALWGAMRRPLESQWPYRALVGTALCAMGTLVYGGYTDRQAQNQLAGPQPVHEEAVKQEASPRVEGNIVYNSELRLLHPELRLLHPETREFERFVMPKGLEESAK
jgi:hypothetical protein